MTEENRTYIAIDLKSFYASVECVERKLDPLTTNLVVADSSRTEKTICLAVSPSLKAYGVSGRARLFEVVSRVKEINAMRRLNAPGGEFSGDSFDDTALKQDPGLKLSYITAPPRMSRYIEYSNRIYRIYLKYIAPEDIHVYSIDECFIDVTHYLSLYKMSARDLAMAMIREVLYDTGITATGGIGTNLYLCKVAMDIVAKHVPADKDGVRLASLDESSYRKLLWNHTPLTDFWRIGRGYARRLHQLGLHTMGDVAECSIHNEELLYKTFGINAELLIDHAWGWEPVTMKEIKSYRPQSNSISSGQVLKCPYTMEKCEIIIKEMTDLLILDLVNKHMLTDQIVLTISYDRENMKDPARMEAYHGDVTLDHYGRLVPSHAHGSVNLKTFTSGTREIMESTLDLYREITHPSLLIRRVNITACHLKPDDRQEAEDIYHQMSLFEDFGEAAEENKKAKKEKDQERRLQQAILCIQKRYGKNAILKGTSLEDGATTIERNGQIGGHKA